MTWQLAVEDLALPLCAAFNSSNTRLNKMERLQQNILCLNIFSQGLRKLVNFMVTDKAPKLMFSFGCFVQMTTNEVVTPCCYQFQVGFNHWSLQISFLCFMYLTANGVTNRYRKKNKLYVSWYMKYGMHYALTSKGKKKKKASLNSPTAFHLKIKPSPPHLNNFRLPFTPQLWSTGWWWHFNSKVHTQTQKQNTRWNLWVRYVKNTLWKTISSY